MNTLDDLKNIISHGKVDVDKMTISDQNLKAMRNVQQARESINGTNQERPTNLFSKGIHIIKETKSAVEKSGWIMKGFLLIGAAILTHNYIYTPLKENISSAKAMPSHYSNPISLNTLTSKIPFLGIERNKGDINAPLSESMQSEWLKDTIKPLSNTVKNAIAPELDKAMEGGLSLKESTDLSNRVYELNRHFFGISMPQADAKRIDNDSPIPKPKM